MPEKLRRLGIPFRVGTNPARRQIFFRDPDGNLIELQPAADAKTSYFRTEPLDWAHHWPPEILWVARRAR